ncbi:hypothetical protein GCM10010300_78210 [Streptomyces olivaceoviridis]|nr:hypothetical protein GCM10010300_78210 [Streptomyces olivaceoviridis]
MATTVGSPGTARERKPVPPSQGIAGTRDRQVGRDGSRLRCPRVRSAVLDAGPGGGSEGGFGDGGGAEGPVDGPLVRSRAGGRTAPYETAARAGMGH